MAITGGCLRGFRLNTPIHMVSQTLYCIFTWEQYGLTLTSRVTATLIFAGLDTTGE